MSQLKSKLESLLFITNHPMSDKKLAELTKSEVQAVKNELKVLIEEYNQEGRGVNINKVGDKYQIVTAGDNRSLIQEFIKDETTGELTKPQLETLTIIAYRGPIGKLQLEQIRGVNCSLILRNLMMRGLIDAKDDKEKHDIYYQVTFDFLKFLGVNQVEELPDYEKLNSSEILDRLLAADDEATEASETINSSPT